MRKAVEWAVMSALLMYSYTSFRECGLVLQVLGRPCGCIVDNGTTWGWYESVVVSNWGRFTKVDALHHFGETSPHTDWTTVILPDFLLHFSRVNCLSPQHILGVTPSENPAFFPKPHIAGTSNAEHTITSVMEEGSPCFLDILLHSMRCQKISFPPIAHWQAFLCISSW